MTVVGFFQIQVEMHEYNWQSRTGIAGTSSLSLLCKRLFSRPCLFIDKYSNR